METHILTEEEFLEQFGNVKVMFSEYYKYTFIYTGKVDDKKIIVKIGGVPDDIYKHYVNVKKKYSIFDLPINYAAVYKENVLIAEMEKDEE